MSEKKKSTYQQQEEAFNPVTESMEKEFQNALRDLSVAARKLRIKGGLIKSGAEGTPLSGE